MKLSQKLKLAAVFTGAIAITTLSVPALAQFDEEPLPSSEPAVAVAVPAGAIGYNLNVVQQVAGKQPCFAEQGSNPTIIEPTWTTFDYTKDGSCKVSTDSNGYSVRLDGQDNSLDYRLDIISKGDNLQLVAKNYKGQGDLVVGQSNGKPEKGKYVKIDLNPGWEITKKAYQGKILGPFFLSGNSQAIAAAGDGSAPAPQPSASSDSKFSDIARDIYKDEIENAVSLGFIAGFKDNTFAPTDSLTREQLVSMVYGALENIEALSLETPEVPVQPYSDVESSRWSANKIQWAKENDVVKGYPDGTFKPGNPVTRAELVTVLQNVAKFANLEQGEAAELVANKQATNFSDTNGHWATKTIQTMSAYCGVASPTQEVGDAFNPNDPAQRNYAAAATLRTYNCLTEAEQ